MFITNFSHILRAHITESKRYFIVKSSTYYFHMKMKILAGFEICIGVPNLARACTCIAQQVIVK